MLACICMAAENNTKYSKNYFFYLLRSFSYNQNSFLSPFCHKQKDNGFEEKNNDEHHNQS